MPRLQPQTLRAVRSRIEDAALQLFIKKGFSATTTREIAEDSGLTPGALYIHFPGKEALFAAVVDKYRSTLAGAGNPLTEVLQRSDFPFDLPVLASAIRDLVQKHRAYWLLWYVDVLEFEGKHFRSALAPRALLGSPALKKRFAALKRERVLRIEPELAFTMVYMHLFNYFLVEQIFGGNDHYGVSEKRAIDSIVDVFLRGMLRNEAKS